MSPVGMGLVIRKINGKDQPAEMEEIREVRRIVFINEQDCTPECEWEYEEESIFFLATFDEKPCGVSRWRKTDEGYKLERFAVLKEYRRRGIASALMTFTLADLPDEATYVYLNAQIYAMGLYAKFGFVPVGKEFEEVGIPHLKMVRQLE